MGVQYTVTTIVRPNAIVRVHRPELTKEEYEHRMKLIKDAAALLLKSKYEKSACDDT